MAQDETPASSEGARPDREAAPGQEAGQAAGQEADDEKATGGEATGGETGEAGGKEAGEARKETRAERRKRLREERRAKRRAKRAARRAEKKRKAEERKRRRAEARARARGETLPQDDGQTDSGDGTETAATDTTSDGTDPAAGDGQESAAGASGDSAGGALEGRTASSKSDTETSEEVRPWAKGVSKEDQEAALSLFRDGNKLLKDALFVRAEAKYKEALDRWDHPGIHFNRSLALLNLDQPLELHASLEKSMQHGPDALGKGKFDQAKTMMKTVKGQLAYLKVVCLEPDAEVTLDGKKLFTAPGEWEGLVLVGEHNAVASKTGYINAIKVSKLRARERGAIELQLFTADDVTEYRRRWAVWKPWTVFGVGTAIALGGGLTHLFSFQNFQEFDKAVEACGIDCTKDDLTPEEAKLDDRARLQQNVAYSMYAVGGVSLLTGLVLVYANRTKPFRIDVEERDRNNLIVMPVVSPEMTGVNALIRF